MRFTNEVLIEEFKRHYIINSRGSRSSVYATNATKPHVQSNIYRGKKIIQEVHNVGATGAWIKDEFNHPEDHIFYWRNLGGGGFLPMSIVLPAGASPQAGATSLDPATGRSWTEPWGNFHNWTDSGHLATTDPNQMNMSFAPKTLPSGATVPVAQYVTVYGNQSVGKWRQILFHNWFGLTTSVLVMKMIND